MKKQEVVKFTDKEALEDVLSGNLSRSHFATKHALAGMVWARIHGEIIPELEQNVNYKMNRGLLDFFKKNGTTKEIKTLARDLLKKYPALPDPTPIASNVKKPPTEAKAAEKKDPDYDHWEGLTDSTDDLTCHSLRVSAHDLYSSLCNNEEVFDKKMQAQFSLESPSEVIVNFIILFYLESWPQLSNVPYEEWGLAVMRWFIKKGFYQEVVAAMKEKNIDDRINIEVNYALDQFYNNTYHDQSTKIDIESLKYAKRDAEFWEKIRKGFLDGRGVLFLEALVASGAFDILFPAPNKNHSKLKKLLQAFDDKQHVKTYKNKKKKISASGQVEAMLLMAGLPDNASENEIKALYETYKISVPYTEEFVTLVKNCIEAPVESEEKQEAQIATEHPVIVAETTPVVEVVESEIVEKCEELPIEIEQVTLPQPLLEVTENPVVAIIIKQEVSNALTELYDHVYKDDSTEIKLENLKQISRDESFWNIINKGLVDGRGEQFFNALLNHGVFETVFPEQSSNDMLWKKFKKLLQTLDFKQSNKKNKLTPAEQIAAMLLAAGLPQDSSVKKIKELHKKYQLSVICTKQFISQVREYIDYSVLNNEEVIEVVEPEVVKASEPVEEAEVVKANQPVEEPEAVKANEPVEQAEPVEALKNDVETKDVNNTLPISSEIKESPVTTSPAAVESKTPASTAYKAVEIPKSDAPSLLLEFGQELKNITGEEALVGGSTAPNLLLKKAHHDWDIRLFQFDQTKLANILESKFNKTTPTRTWRIVKCKNILNTTHPIIRLRIWDEKLKQIQKVEIAIWQKAATEKLDDAVIRILNQGCDNSLSAMYAWITADKLEVKATPEIFEAFEKKQINIVNNRLDNFKEDIVRLLRLVLKKGEYKDFGDHPELKQCLQSPTPKECFQEQLRFPLQQKRVLTFFQKTFFARNGLVEAINLMHENFDIFQSLTGVSYDQCKDMLNILRCYDKSNPFTKSLAFCKFILTQFCLQHAHLERTERVKALNAWPFLNVIYQSVYYKSKVAIFPRQIFDDTIRLHLHREGGQELNQGNHNLQQLFSVDPKFHPKKALLQQRQIQTRRALQAMQAMQAMQAQAMQAQAMQPVQPQPRSSSGVIYQLLRVAPRAMNPRPLAMPYAAVALPQQTTAPTRNNRNNTCRGPVSSSQRPSQTRTRNNAR